MARPRHKVLAAVLDLPEEGEPSRPVRQPAVPIRFGYRKNDAEAVNSPRFVIAMLLTALVAVGFAIVIMSVAGVPGFKFEPAKLFAPDYWEIKPAKKPGQGQADPPRRLRPDDLP